MLSGSVALLGDALHNSADALTAVPLGLAFMLSRRRPNRRYTYGYGRAEDLAGLVIVALTEQAEATLRATPGVLEVGQFRLRWVGHTLRAECQISVDPNCSVVQAHDVAVGAEHGLIHAMPRLAAVTVHADPAGGADHHALLADHLGLHPRQDAGQQGAHPVGGDAARLDDLGVAEAMPGQARRQVGDQRDAEHVGPHLARGDRL